MIGSGGRSEFAETSPGWDVRAAVCAVGAAKPSEHSDEALVFLLQTAVTQHVVDDLFQEIFARYNTRVVAWCARITRDPDRASDLTQEVFFRAFRRLHTFRGDSRFSTWLYAITRNHCLNALKKRSTEPVEDGEAVPVDLLGSHGMEVHYAMERHQSFQSMWRLIQRTLTPLEARVMALHYGHGLPLAVITRHMLLSNPSGAKAYIVNARRKLGAVLRGGDAASGVTHFRGFGPPVHDSPPADLLLITSSRRGVFTDTAIVGAVAILAKIMGAVKSVAIARVFGSGAALDAYLLAFLVPSILADIFCGALVPVMVPALIGLDRREGESSAHALYAQMFRRATNYSVFGTLVVAFGAGVIAYSGLISSSGKRLTAVLVLSMCPTIPLAALANVWRAVLNARRDFLTPALSAVVTPAVIAAVVLLAGQGVGILALGVATTMAGTAEVAVLAFAVRKARLPIFPAACRSSFHFGSLTSEYSYLAATAAVGAGGLFIGQAMASTLGVGSVSILNYGTRLAGVLLGIGPAALSVTILPRFSELAAERDWTVFRRSLVGVLVGAGVVSCLTAALLVFFSVPIVRLTLERGAFIAADTAAVASVQAFSLLQLPFVVIITILMRALAALQSNRALLPASAGALLINVVLAWTLRAGHGVAGIALASSVAQGALCIALGIIVFRPAGWRFLIK